MKILQFTFILLLIFYRYAADAQVPEWNWAKAGRKGSNIGYWGGSGFTACTDTADNIYTLGGYFVCSLDSPLDRDVYITKFNSSGDIVWVRSFGGVGHGDVSSGICTDISGNIFVTGELGPDTMTFIGNDTLHNLSGDIYFAKYNSAGDLIWFKTISEGRGCAVASDCNGNIYMTGFYGTDTLRLDTVTLVNNLQNQHGASCNLFIVKYNAAGNVVWVRSGGGGRYVAESYGLAVDACGSAYITGRSDCDSLNFGDHTLHNAQGFVVKYDSSGNVLWAKPIKMGGSMQQEYSPYLDRLCLDPSGNPIVVGCYSNYISFDTTVNYGSGGFMAKYDANGNVLWTRLNPTAQIVTVCADASGDIYLGGNYGSDSIGFGNLILTRLNSTHDTDYINNTFIAKYDSAGNIIWATTQWQSVDSVYSSAAPANGLLYGLCLDKEGDLIENGLFQCEKIAFGHDTLINVNVHEAYDVYLAKMGTHLTAISSLSPTPSITVYPNPASGSCTISCAAIKGRNYTAQFVDMTGSEVGPLWVVPGSFVFDVSKYAKGLYLLKITDSDGSFITRKLVVE